MLGGVNVNQIACPCTLWRCYSSQFDRAVAFESRANRFG
jgi:hypothetical protein